MQRLKDKVCIVTGSGNTGNITKPADFKEVAITHSGFTYKSEFYFG